MVVLRVAFYRKGMRRKSFVVLVAIRTCQLAKNKNAAGASGPLLMTINAGSRAPA